MTIFKAQQLNLQRPGIIPMLILVEIVVLFPLWFYLPLWISLSTMALLLLKYTIHQKSIKIPNWIVLGLVISGLLAVYLQFNSIRGRDAGVGLISLMYTFKLLEAKSYRDGALILFISFFLLVTVFLYNESIWMGLYLLIAVSTILIGLMILNNLRGTEALNVVSKGSLKTLLQAVPLMLLLFFLFPRLPGPLWAMPNDLSAGTGISDTMSPGDIGYLQTLDDIAFRVDFDGQAPPIGQMYWRGIVMSEFDGFTWSQGRRSLLRSPNLPQREETYRYKIQMEPNQRRWLFGLEEIADPPQGVFLFDDGTWRRPQQITQRFSYQASAYQYQGTGIAMQSWHLELHKALPEQGNQRTRDWAQQQFAQAGSADNFIQLVLSEIRQKNYRYTLAPEILEQEVIDGFWFDTQEGFCEHYSSAFVFIMRAAGIPARVVTGYQGGEYNPYGDYYVVRQSDAHAWTEVWLAGEGWRRIDPTAAIHPSRVDASLQSQTANRDDWFGEFLARDATQVSSNFMKQIALRWDAVQNFWNENLMGYNQDAQFGWLSKLGIKYDQWRYLGYAMVLILLLAGITFALWIIGRRQSKDKIEKGFYLIIDKLQRKGLEYQTFSGPQALQQQLKIEHPKLSEAVKPLLDSYIALRYQAKYPSQKKVNDFYLQAKRLSL